MLVAPDDAVGGEAQGAADEQGAEEEGDSQLLGRCMDGLSVR